MPKNQQQVQVVKVPLKGLPTSKPQVFPHMPRLYLELMENKSKIRQDLINKEHVPNKTNDYPSIDERTAATISHTPELPKASKETSDKFASRLDMLLSDSDDSYSSDDSSSEQSNSSTPSSVSEVSIVEKVTKPPREEAPSEVSDDLSVRLKELLNDDSDTNSEYSRKKSSAPPTVPVNKYSKHRDRSGHSISHAPAPPTLAELEERGGYIPRKELRDINQQGMNTDQQDEDTKRELLFKFDLLRKSYPASSIPDYTIHTDLSTMEKSYADCVRRLSLDSSVDNYKTYLVYGFMGCEFILGNFLGFDMQGFTQQQIISMHSYEKMLIELGEKSYVPSGSKWPVELRLLFMIIMNAAFFVISKMMMKKTGANLMGMINGMNGGSSSVGGNTTTSSAPKRKMRGPSVDLNDLPGV